MAVEITGITTTPLSDKKTDDSAAATSNVASRSNQDSERTSNTLTSASANPNDKVTLTQQAEELRMIEKAVNEQTGIDNERVESLKIEIDTGRYDINSERVAEKLIEFETLFVA
jgi:negative regulator of flagellin synthesis FlgM